MNAPVKTSQEWQELLDEKFPQGAVVAAVRTDGTLSGEQLYRCPVLVVVAMRGEWPVIVGIDSDGKDIQLMPASWEEIDRSGHFAARVQQAPIKDIAAGTYDLNSWFSENLAAAMMTVRDSQREWLLQVAESAHEETLEPAQSSEAPGDRAPSAEPTENMALTLSHI